MQSQPTHEYSVPEVLREPLAEEMRQRVYRLTEEITGSIDRGVLEPRHRDEITELWALVDELSDAGEETVPRPGDVTIAVRRRLLTGLLADVVKGLVSDLHDHVIVGQPDDGLPYHYDRVCGLARAIEQAVVLRGRASGDDSWDLVFPGVPREDV